MRELGVEEWDPLSGRIKLFPSPPAREIPLSEEERRARDSAEQRIEEIRFEREQDDRYRRYMGATSGIRPSASAVPSAQPGTVRRSR